MVGRHHQLDEHKSEQAPGVGDGQGSLACCSPWGRRESDTLSDRTESNIGKKIRDKQPSSITEEICARSSDNPIT